jgi:hypothetical protein
MMDQSVYVAWIIAIDLAALILAATAAKRMTRGILKGAYFAFLVTGIVWVNLIFLVRYFPISPDVAVYLSRGIFVSILATLTAFGCFMVVFCGMNQELRTLRFGAFIVWNGVLGVLSAAGFVENGLKQTEFGLAPIYGPFHPVLILSNFAWGAYIFWMVWRAFSASHNPVFKNQLRMLFAYCLFTFLWAGVINGVLPAVFGTSRYSHIGPLGFLVLYLGILRIVGEERNLFVERDLKALLRASEFRRSQKCLWTEAAFCRGRRYAGSRTAKDLSPWNTIRSPRWLINRGRVPCRRASPDNACRSRTCARSSSEYAHSRRAQPSHGFRSDSGSVHAAGYQHRKDPSRRKASDAPSPRGYTTRGKSSRRSSLEIAEK